MLLLFFFFFSYYIIWNLATSLNSNTSAYLPVQCASVVALHKWPALGFSKDGGSRECELRPYEFRLLVVVLHIWGLSQPFTEVFGFGLGVGTSGPCVVCTWSGVFDRWSHVPAENRVTFGLS